MIKNIQILRSDVLRELLKSKKLILDNVHYIPSDELLEQLQGAVGADGGFEVSLTRGKDSGTFVLIAVLDSRQRQGVVTVASSKSLISGPPLPPPPPPSAGTVS